MEVIVNIAYWYASPGGAFIRMFRGEKPLHVLPWYDTDKLIMQEVSEHLAIGLSARLHRNNKAPWPCLPLRIILYEIKSSKDAHYESKDITKFEFNTKDFNPCDPHSIFKDQCTRVYFCCINMKFHWLEEDPLRYCYNSSKLNESVSIERTWKAYLQT